MSNDKQDRLGLFAWACGSIREHVDKGSFGTVTIAMANGVISSVKTEINQKPPIDAPAGTK